MSKTKEDYARINAEYQAVLKIMQRQVKLSPYNPAKKLKLVIDGASSIGTGFILVQLLDKKQPEKRCNIIHAGSSLLPEGRDFSPMESEAIVLDRAMTSCQH